MIQKVGLTHINLKQASEAIRARLKKAEGSEISKTNFERE